ncbi:MAG TPA: ComF family protein [Burkholderiales bacterium]|nr:ComF family protein [Burkholderiales bacterium]
MSNTGARLLNRCLEIGRKLLPHYCLLCGAASHPSLLCAACDRTLVRPPLARCPVCALPAPAANTCGACLAHPPHYDAVAAAFIYAYPLDALIQSFKYGANLVVARLLGEALADAVAEQHVDLIVPMPLSLARLRERGFNQAHEIARYLAAASGLPIARSACRRVIDTAAQAALPWKARAGNVRGAFACDADLSGCTVAIVDDVMTTGATVDELARCMRRAGAREIRAWVAARALRRDNHASAA